MGSIQSDMKFQSKIDYVYEMEKMDKKLMELIEEDGKTKEPDVNNSHQNKNNNNEVNNVNNNFLNLLTPENENQNQVQNAEENNSIENDVNKQNTKVRNGPFFSVNVSPIVISGISGRFPQSSNMEEFMDNLLAGTDMVTVGSERWTPGLYGIPGRAGKLKELDKFDGQFFGVHSKQAHFMDPQLRILHEITHEAIIDAGVNPISIRGSNTGVFIGVTESESLVMNTERDAEEISGYELLGSARAMFANRLSYTFDLKGPSFAIDTACSSSIVALNEAVSAIRLGHCDAAIVGAVNLCLKAKSSLMPFKLGMLSPEGMCKAYDAAGNGYARSEGAVVIYITKADLGPKRSYAEIIHVRISTDGYKEQGVTFPSGKAQKQLLETIYAEAGIPPAEVSYVETHGTGTSAGDPQELNSIADVFCKNRPAEKPLLIGSVKSNMGHSEPASGLCSLAKILIAMQKGVLPTNLHFNSPNLNIPALVDGRFKVVSQNTKWDGGLVGLNNFGFGGSNSHLILRTNPKIRPASLIRSPENSSFPDNFSKKSLPVLVPFSGRTKDAVESALKQISFDVDQEAIALFHEIHRQNISGHNFRGFASIDNNKMETPESTDNNKILDMQIVQLRADQNSGEKPPVWFVFSGMGSQWPKMGVDLMRFSAFRKSIHKSTAVLQQKTNGQLNLLEILLEGSDATFDNVLNSFVSITAVQIALVDLLTSLGVTPDGIVGHSVGELACAYADGCFSSEQTILAAFSRGEAILSSKNSNFQGAMAAVGLTWEMAKLKCPRGVFPVCHNSGDSVTISGPLDLVQTFVQDLKTEGIFAKVVNSSGIAFHSPYINDAAPKLKESLEKIIGCKPKSRSSRWISSSVPESEWTSSSLALFSSADYHVNNLLSPVLFHEAISHVPENALVVEIAPTGLLQAILKRSLPVSCVNVAVSSRSASDNANHFLSAVGKMFNAGIQPLVGNLYKKMEFPVSAGARFLSPLIKWDHAISHHVPHENASHQKSGENSIEISLDKESDEFFKGHQIDGRIMFPATGYLFLVWKSLAKSKGTTFDKLPVVFENVQFLKPTLLQKNTNNNNHKSGRVKFNINIFEGTGEFQIVEETDKNSNSSTSDNNSTATVTGIVRVISPDQHKKDSEFLPVKSIQILENAQNLNLVMTSAEIYKELGLRGYDYSGIFQGIQMAHVDGEWGKLRWQNNWVSFLDTILQFSILGMKQHGRNLILPTRLQKLTLDPLEFLQFQPEEKEEEKELVPVFSHQKLNLLKCRGVEIRGLSVNTAPRKLTGPQATPTIEEYKFTPYFQSPENVTTINHETGESSTNFDTALRFLVDVAAENSETKNLKMSEIVNQNPENSVASKVIRILMLQPIFQVDMTVFLPPPLEKLDSSAAGEKEKELEKSGAQIIKSHDPAEMSIHLENSHLTICDDATRIENLIPLMKNESFLLFQTQQQNFNPPKSKIMDAEMKLVAHRKTGNGHNFYLLRKIENSSQNLQQINIQISNKNFDWIDQLKSAMKKAADFNANNKSTGEFRINLVSRNEPESGILGLVNCLKLEPEGQFVRCFFVRGHDDDDDENSPVELDFINNDQQNESFQSILSSDLLMNVFDKSSGTWGCYRHFTVEDPGAGSDNPEHILQPGENAHVEISTKGDFSSLKWVKSQQEQLQNYGNDEDRNPGVSVFYSALNPRDVAVASGSLSIHNPNIGSGVFGLEFSGMHKNRRVMGAVSSGSLSTEVKADPHFLWTIPESWTTAEAATTPIVYLTAFYSLVVRGKLTAGESVLIHNGISGPGQAAIAVALNLNCNVFSTVDSGETKGFLLQLFPQLNSQHVLMVSSFEQDLLETTNGEGVDVVLTSVAGQNAQLLESVRCLAENGRFLDISGVSRTHDNNENKTFAAQLFSRSVTYNRILLENLLDHSNKNNNKISRSLLQEKRQVHDLMTDGLKSGVVRPLQHHIFSQDEISAAFRLISSGQQKGKVLIQLHGENSGSSEESAAVEESSSSKNNNNKMMIRVIRPVYFSPEKSYVLLGGLGGFGMELADFMMTRGARKLALVSRSGVSSGFQEYRIRQWKRQYPDLAISFPTTNAATIAGAKSLLQETISDLGGPLGGIFNLAAVLRDALMENQTLENFQLANGPKGDATKSLDQVTRACPQFSSQLDHFVVFSSVNCSRGKASQTTYGFANAVMERVVEKRQADGLTGCALEWGMIGDTGILLSLTRGNNEMEMEGSVPQRIHSCLAVLDKLLRAGRRTPIVSSWVLADKNKKNWKNGDSGVEELSLVEGISGIMDMDLTTLNPGATLAELGMDSLMGIEVSNYLKLYMANKFKTISGSSGAVPVFTMTQIRAFTIKRLVELESQAENSSSTKAAEISTLESSSAEKVQLDENGNEITK